MAAASPFLSRSKTVLAGAFVPRSKTVRENRLKRRIHEIVPWFKNPLQGIDKASLVFAPRHEASTLELFFDLFFVANLATFTAYHTITDNASVGAYIGFFAIIWVSWYHTTLHDVRFGNDSIYERICKAIQMITFVGFALIGTDFNPGSDKADNETYQTLCYALGLSRALLTVQYFIVGAVVAKARRTDLYLPLFLNIFMYAAATGVYIGMSFIFPADKPADPTTKIWVLWWVTMAVEILATVTISCVWRILSFKKTHLIERMELLTLIVIGEGAIGVTKTVSKLLGKGIYAEGVGQIIAIILILLGLWMIYFDNKPHGHFGTIAQQIYATRLFMTQLAIVGVVEGAQQLAMARYVNMAWDKLVTSSMKYCFDDHLDGTKLASKLNDTTVIYYQLYKKLETLLWAAHLEDELGALGNMKGICGSKVNGTGFSDLPVPLQSIVVDTTEGVYAGLGIKVRTDKAESLIDMMIESWSTIYFYWWWSMFVLLLSFILHTFTVRRNKFDAFDWSSLVGRVGGLGVVSAFLAFPVTNNGKDHMYKVIDSPYLLPIGVLLLYFIIFVDRFGKWVANRRNRLSGEALIVDEDEHHGGHEHDEHEHPHAHTAEPHSADTGHGARDTAPLMHTPSYEATGAWTSGAATPGMPAGYSSPPPQNYRDSSYSVQGIPMAAMSPPAQGQGYYAVPQQQTHGY